MYSYLIRILSVTSIMVLLSACNGGAPKPAQIDRSLPSISVNGYLSDMTSVAFEWKPVEDPRVKYIVVYRNDPSSKTPNKLKEINALEKVRATHYLDRDLQPGTIYYYSFATRDAKEHTSLATKKIKAQTRPLLPSVSYFAASDPLARAAKLIWRPHTDMRVVEYRLERRMNGQDKWKKIATIDGRLNAEYIDEDLKDNTRYEYRLIAITFDDFRSKPSKVVEVNTVPLPQIIKQVSASQGKAGVIEISWKVPKDPTITGYNLYRASSKSGHYSLLKEKLKSTHYTDTVKTPGTQYFYKVVGLNKYNIQGDLKLAVSVTGTTLDAPRAPKNLVAMVENATVQLTWKSSDQRIVSFVVIKKTEKSFISSETKEFKNIKKTLMIDSSLQPDEKYTYSVIGVDKNGIRSAPSNTVVVKIQNKK